MTNIAQHISALLYQHNCVIVPEFGGFVADYASAEIHPVEHSFTPPSKKIAFNKNLTNNDGLLANRIVAKEKVSYTDATEKIHQFVASLNTELSNKKSVNISDIGTLSLDVEGNLQFKQSPTNFSLASFGLTSFKSPAITLEPMVKKIEKSIKKEMQSREAIPAPKRKINFKRVAAFALILPLIAGTLWLSIKSDFVQNANYANILSFTSSTPRTDTVVIYTYTDSIVDISDALAKLESTLNDDTTIVDSTPKIAAIIATEQKAPVTVVKVEPIKKEQKVKHKKVVKLKTIAKAPKKERKRKSNKGFHLVVGCFKSEQNAENFVTKLKQKNINASIAGKNKNGLFVISGGGFDTKEEALKSLPKVKDVQPNAWVYKHSF